MRIALISFEYPPFHGGGIGTYAGILAELLSQEHDVHVVTNAWDSSSLPGVSHQGNLTVHRMAALTREYEPPATASDRERAVWSVGGPALRWSVMAADCLSQIHRDVHLDIVEAPECFAEAHVALRRRRCGVDLVDLPMSVTLHTPIWEHHGYNHLPRRGRHISRRSRMEDECILWADGLTSPSRSLRDLIYARLGIEADSHPCDIIPYPVRTLQQSGRDPRNGPSWLGAKERVLLFVGRLEARKGVDTLLAAAIPILQEESDVRLVMVGNSGETGTRPGRMVDWLKSQVPPGLEGRVRFTGLLPHEHVQALYARAAVCVFPAVWDNYPLVCCEAMAEGACIVASRVGGLAEILEHEVSGLLVPPRDPAALAQAVRRCLHDPALRRDLGMAARERIREVSDARSIIQRRLEHYQRTMEAAVSRSRKAR